MHLSAYDNLPTIITIDNRSKNEYIIYRTPFGIQGLLCVFTNFCIRIVGFSGDFDKTFEYYLLFGD